MASSADLAWIKNQHQLTAEIREFRRVGGNFNFAGLVEISELLDKARISGSGLETVEILSVITVVDRAAEWRAIAINPPQGMKQDWTAVGELSLSITDFTEFLRSFRNKILPDGTLDDRASPALAAFRRDVENQKRGIQVSLLSYVRQRPTWGVVHVEGGNHRGHRVGASDKREN